MPTGKILAIDYSQPDSSLTFIPRPRIHSSQQAGWKNIHIAHYQLPAIEIPEATSLQHMISLPCWKQPTEVEMVVDGKRHLLQHDSDEVGYIEMLSAYTPIRVRANQAAETTHCYLDPKFLAHAAYETANPEQVELKSLLSTPDLLVSQIIIALRTVLETDATNSCFYAESMGTALAAHLLRNYSTRKHSLKEHEDGLPKYKLKQALEYMNAHLNENVSLATISEKLGMSQYYFCRLFKQSTGITPHAYLIQQRVEMSKQLLKQKEVTIVEIAIRCGFANPSHFAKHFQKHTGMLPKQFRML
ncbi:MAG: AraC family transcriptional regulator [Oscillatoria sp. PMC 1068.18]|nr:AraC family transcriptional regulator [Oscillatoria sp. PMC 1076.18]MEC4990491.1 AraC family transcriptional regulator [Oscillatoria sp. PMC 1068.18]